MISTILYESAWRQMYGGRRQMYGGQRQMYDGEVIDGSRGDSNGAVE